MSAANNMTPLQLADELSLIGRNGFLTSESHGPSRSYKVEIKFGSLKEMQDFHSALYFIINRSLAVIPDSEGSNGPLRP